MVRSARKNYPKKMFKLAQANCLSIFISDNKMIVCRSIPDIFRDGPKPTGKMAKPCRNTRWEFVLKYYVLNFV